MSIRMLLLLVLLCPALANCQDMKLKGKVIDEEGVAIAGATVTLIHTSGTPPVETRTIYITDANGQWNGERSLGMLRILVTAVGFEPKELKAPAPGALTITLTRKDKVLEEVKVNTGYQQLPKERQTGSFTVVDKDKLNEITGPDLLPRLALMANGVTSFSARLSSSPNPLIIRGISTVSGVKEPLIVLDNFPFAGDLSNINPNEVENITVLKDAAAASIWGAQAGNGVIVITTKKGKYNKPLHIEFNASYTVKAEPDLFYEQKISTRDQMEVEQFLFTKGYRFSDTASTAHYPFSPLYELLFKQRRGLVSQSQVDEQVNAWSKLDMRDGLLRYFYQPSLNQQYAINLSGGSNSLAWLFSAGMDRNRDNLDGSYKRYNLRYDNRYRAGKNIELYSSLTFTGSSRIAGKSTSFPVSKGVIPPYFQFEDANGNAAPLYTKYRQGFIDTVGGGKLLDWKFYPLTNGQSVHNGTNGVQVIISGGMNIKIIKILSLDLNCQYNWQQTEMRILYDPESFFTRDLVNTFSQLNRTTGVVTYKIPNGAILDVTNTGLEGYNGRAQLNLNWSKGPHSLTALMGAEASENRTRNKRDRTYGYNPDILTLVNVDYVNTYPTFFGTTGMIANVDAFNSANNRLVSLFGNAGYTFRQRYGITASARRDGSNLFGASINNKWKPLWSVGSRWVISSEKFYHLDKIPYLQFRVTYGHTGIVDPSKVALTTISYGGVNPYTQTPYASVANFVNPYLSWEQVNMLNTGFDFRNKSNRISGSLELYQKWMVHMYSGTSLEPTTGISRSVGRNEGTMRGRGIDLELNTVLIDKKFRWTNGFIINYTKDKFTTPTITSTSVSAKTLATGPTSIQGYPAYGYFAYRWAGLDPATGDPQGYLDGQISKNYPQLTGAGTKLNDLVFIGNLLPQVFGSVSNSFSWKNITLTLRLTYKLGYYFRRPALSYAEVFAGAGTNDYARRWKQPGDEARTNIPSMIYPNPTGRDDFYYRTEIFATKGDHIRLQYINLKYSLPDKLLAKLKMQAAELYFVTNEVGIIWRANKQHIDPDYPGLPPVRSIAFGARIRL